MASTKDNDPCSSISSFPCENAESVRNSTTESSDSSSPKFKSEEVSCQFESATSGANCQSNVNLCHYVGQVLREQSPVLQDSDFREILSCLRDENDMMTRSKGYVVLAYFCTSDEFFKDVVAQQEFDVMCEILKTKPLEEQGLLFFRALLASVLTNQNLSLKQTSQLTRCIKEYLNIINTPQKEQDSFQWKLNTVFYTLPNELQKIAHVVCARILPISESVPISEIDIRFLTFIALRNLSGKQIILTNPNFFMQAMGHVFESFQQLVMLPTFCAMTTVFEKDGRYQFHVESVLLCLEFMTNAVSSSCELRKYLFLLSNKAFIKCMNRILGFALNALFSDLSLDVDSVDNVVLDRVLTTLPKMEFLHLNCLQHALKLLVNFFRHSDNIQYTVPVSLVEKLLFCFMQTCYRQIYNKFELTFMALELMVNTVLLNMIHRNEFAKLCLMKLRVGNESHRTIEVMIKVLGPIVERIEILKEENNSQEIPSFENYLCEEPMDGRIFEVAEEHMEHTFICVYICAWISLFCDYREPFLEHANRLLTLRTVDCALQALTQMRNFLPLLGDNGFAEVVLKRSGETFLRLKEGCNRNAQSENT